MSYGNIPSVRVPDLPNPLPEDVTVLDVREPMEWVHGHIEGALHVPMHDLPAALPDLPDGRLLVVCAVGGRSAHAVAYLAAHGRDALNLDGGMVDWAQAGRPMVSETGQPPHVA